MFDSADSDDDICPACHEDVDMRNELDESTLEN